MSALPRGTCPACGRDVPIRRNGDTREHRRPADTGTGRVCPGRLAHNRQLEAERARILRALAAELDEGCSPRFLMDGNGNTAGVVVIQD